MNEEDLIGSYDKLPVYRRAMDLSVTIYRIVRKWPEEERQVLTDMILQKMMQVTVNIMEGAECGSKEEFLEHLDVSRGGLAAVSSMLYIALDREYITQEMFDNAQKSIDDVASLINTTQYSLRHNLPLNHDN